MFFETLLHPDFRSYSTCGNTSQTNEKSVHHFRNFEASQHHCLTSDLADLDLKSATFLSSKQTTVAPTLTSVPVCAEQPSHPNHPPPEDKPLRVCVLGPLYAIEQICPDVKWPPGFSSDRSFFDEAGTHLSRLTFSVIYGREPDESRSDDLIFKESAYNIRKGFAHTT